MRTKTARDFFYEAHRRIADANKTFVFDILPTLTLAEFDKLLAKRPHVYGKYKELVTNTRGA